MKEYKYAVFSNCYDAGVLLFETYEEAEEEFNERVNGDLYDGADGYLVEIKKGYKAKKDW